MRGRAGALLVIVGLFAAGLAAGAIKAGLPVPNAPPPTTTTTETTATTDVTTTTAPTTTAPTTTTTAAPVVKTIAAVRPPSGCVFVTGFALRQPGRPQLVLGCAAASRGKNFS